MANIIDLLEKIMTVTSNVADLKSQVSRIEVQIKEHNERIVRLEARREDFIIEKCKSTALTAVNQISNGLTEKLTELNFRFKQLGQ
jgi:predicted  nucleic acid-binding Zn-ribbon protein